MHHPSITHPSPPIAARACSPCLPLYRRDEAMYKWVDVSGRSADSVVEELLGELAKPHHQGALSLYTVMLYTVSSICTASFTCFHASSVHCREVFGGDVGARLQPFQGLMSLALGIWLLRPVKCINVIHAVPAGGTRYVALWFIHTYTYMACCDVLALWLQGAAGTAGGSPRRKKRRSSATARCSRPWAAARRQTRQ